MSPVWGLYPGSHMTPGQSKVYADAARELVEGAPDLDALRAVWSRKAMAPFRAELQELLDEHAVDQLLK